MIKHVCDICGKDIRDIDDTSIYIPNKDGGYSIDGVKMERIDLCDNCFNEINKFVTNIYTSFNIYNETSSAIATAQTCGGCNKTDGLCYTSNPPQLKCTVTGKFHLYSDICDCKESN